MINRVEERSNEVGAPARRVVGTYPGYREAEQAVDRLADEGFPVERVSIVAHGLRFVEQVTGRVGYGRAALNGLSSGAAIGGLFGFIAGLFRWVDPLVSAFALGIYGLLVGVVVGALVGLLIHALSRGRGHHDFASVSSVHADRYEIMADEPVAEEAARLLGTGTAAGIG